MTTPLKWNMSRGYTFYTWIRVESFPGEPFAASVPGGSPREAAASTDSAGGATRVREEVAPPPPAMALFNATMFDGRGVAFAVHAAGLIVQVRALEVVRLRWRASPPHRPRENGLVHPADTSRSNLAAAALARVSRWRLSEP
jgi:hypothetical protein